jgi:hypothetical protein
MPLGLGPISSRSVTGNPVTQTQGATVSATVAGKKYYSQVLIEAMRRDIEAKRRQRDLKEQEEQGLRLIEA